MRPCDHGKAVEALMYFPLTPLSWTSKKSQIRQQQTTISQMAREDRGGSSPLEGR